MDNHYGFIFYIQMLLNVFVQAQHNRHAPACRLGEEMDARLQDAVPLFPP